MTLGGVSLAGLSSMSSKQGREHGTIQEEGMRQAEQVTAHY